MTLLARLTKLAGLVLLATLPVWAQGSRWNGEVTNQQGQPVAGALIWACTSSGTGLPCAPLTAIYADQGLTQPQLQPIKTDSSGRYGFWAASGTYVVAVTGRFVASYSFPVTLGGSGGGGIAALQVNGVTLPTSSLPDLIDSAPFNGLTFTLANPSAAIVQLGAVGTLNNSGLTHSTITINTAGVLAGGGTVALGGSLTLTCPTCSSGISSVGLTQTGSIFTITNSPLTANGSINLAFASEAANTSLRGPTSGSAAAPSFRADVEADLPATTFFSDQNFAMGVHAVDLSLASSLKVPVLGSTQCLQVNTTGVVSGAGTGCGGATTVNGGSPLPSPVNLENGSAVHGLTVAVANPSLGNITFQLSGTLDDAGLTIAYSGVGACGTHLFASTLVRATNPTCTQVGLADLAAGVAAAGLYDFSSATLKVPAGAGFTPSSTSTFGLDTTRENPAFYLGAVFYTPVAISPGSWVDGDCAVVKLTGTQLGVGDSGSAGCTGGGGGSALFTSFKFGTNAAITATGTYFQLTYNGDFTSTYTGAGSSGSPYIATLQLANNSLTVATTSPLAGGGSVALGGTLTLTCTTCDTSAASILDTSVVLGAGGARGLAGSFLTFTGPASSLKTFALPNASATILTSNSPVTVPQGGSGQTSLTAHGVLMGEGTSALGASAAGTSGQPFLSGGASADGAYGALDISTAATTGILAAGKGGTGIANSNTITLAGNLVTAGANSLTLTTTGATNVTLPVSGTLVNTAVTTLSSLASVGTLSTGVWNASVVAPLYGGTGANNGTSTLVLGGNLTTSGSFPLIITLTGSTNVTFPTTGTLCTSATCAGASTGLTNLASVAVNLALTPGTDNSISLDSLSKRYVNGWFSGVLGWTNGSGTADTGFSRDSAGVVDLGNGTAADSSGTLQLALLKTSGSNGGLTCQEGTGGSLTPSTSVDILWCDSTGQRLAVNNHNTGKLYLVAQATAGVAGNVPKYATNGLDIIDSGVGPGGFSGLTTNFLPKATSGTSIANSTLQDNGTIFSGEPAAFGTGNTAVYTSQLADQNVELGSGNGLGNDGGAGTATVQNPILSGKILTNTNCASGAAPAVCSAASVGAVAVPTGINPTLTINTTAITSTSRVFLAVDESLTISGVTCNTTISTLVQPVVTTRTAGTSFTIQIGSTLATNPACVSYFIVN